MDVLRSWDGPRPDLPLKEAPVHLRILDDVDIDRLIDYLRGKGLQLREIAEFIGIPMSKVITRSAERPELRERVLIAKQQRRKREKLLRRGMRITQRVPIPEPPPQRLVMPPPQLPPQLLRIIASYHARTPKPSSRTKPVELKPSEVEHLKVVRDQLGG